MTNEDMPLTVKMAVEFVKSLPHDAENDAVSFLAAAVLVTYSPSLSDLARLFERSASMMKDMAERKFSEHEPPMRH